jgi:hypothetical protein
MIACHSLVSRTVPFSATVATLPLSTVPGGFEGHGFKPMAPSDAVCSTSTRGLPTEPDG